MFLTLCFFAAITVVLMHAILIHRKSLVIAFKTLPRDIMFMSRFIRLRLKLKSVLKQYGNIGEVFESLVEKHPRKPCFYYGDQTWTYIQVENLANKFANYFSEKGYRKNDKVSLLMENRVEYLCIWLGLSKIGVITALINHNLRLQPLQHCVEAAMSKAIIYGFELSQAISDVKNEDSFRGMEYFCFGANGTLMTGPGLDLDFELINASISRPEIPDEVKMNDIVLLVYTSGTTGLPKAAIIKHTRVVSMTYGITYMTGILETDRLYNPLPLYHIGGGVTGAGQALLSGVPVVIINKFSVSNFWKDCIRHNITVSQYIGEMCRYLVNQPLSPEDKLHKVRMMIGNGIKPEVLAKFLDRFSVPLVSELYGATEGNCSLGNIDGNMGSIGFVPNFLRGIIPQTLVCVDPSTGVPIRDLKTGFVIRCKVGESGEMIGKIMQTDPSREFLGYTDSESSQQKIIRNVFKNGDAYFRSGDIMSFDEFGYLYFRDRLGDTFRWKGENVSTTEVEGIISTATGLRDTIVFGVKVPNCDGTAGMAVISDPHKDLDLQILCQALERELPHYARPIFLRTIDSISTTGTFKLQKMDLRNEGFDIHRILSGTVYFLLNGSYVHLDLNLYSKIIRGQIRL